MQAYTFPTRRTWSLVPLFGLSLLIVVGCTSKRPVSEPGERLEPVTLMLNWYPEAEHGGFYAAKVLGIFERYGLDVEIRAGGPNAPVAQELVTGRVQFAIGNADDVLLFRNQGVPVVALMAPIQNTPRCVLVRADSKVTKLSELSGYVLQANAGAPILGLHEIRKPAGGSPGCTLRWFRGEVGQR